MKTITIIFSLFLSVSAFAQGAGKDPLYVVDGVPSAAGKSLKPADILVTSILGDTAAIKVYGQQAANGAFVITTKKFAVNAYQQKLSPFNSRYKKYIDHGHDDSNLTYVLNNTMMNMERKTSIEELYDLRAADIDNVKFKKDWHFKTDATVIITTKTE